MMAKPGGSRSNTKSEEIATSSQPDPPQVRLPDLAVPPPIGNDVPLKKLRELAAETDVFGVQLMWRVCVKADGGAKEKWALWGHNPIILRRYKNQILQKCVVGTRGACGGCGGGAGSGRCKLPEL